MKAKSEKRRQAERLRRERGLSYREISARLGVSRSTLSSWLKDIPLQPEHRKRLRANRAGFAARAWPINRERHRKAREAARQCGAEVARRIPADPAVDELALAMLYLGDGSKTSGMVRMGSVNPDILAYFVQALIRLYQVEVARRSCRLHLAEAARQEAERLETWWSKRLRLPLDNFRPPSYDLRSQVRTISEDYHGVCVVTYSDVKLQQRILGIAREYLRLQADCPRED